MTSPEIAFQVVFNIDHTSDPTLVALLKDVIASGRDNPQFVTVVVAEPVEYLSRQDLVDFILQTEHEGVNTQAHYKANMKAEKSWSRLISAYKYGKLRHAGVVPDLGLRCRICHQGWAHCQHAEMFLSERELRDRSAVGLLRVKASADWQINKAAFLALVPEDMQDINYYLRNRLLAFIEHLKSKSDS